MGKSCLLFEHGCVLYLSIINLTVTSKHQVKRQRSQWRLKQDGKHSNMTDERERALGELGFVWDSHSVFWEERLRELQDFVLRNGHARVPTRYAANPQLAIWCKCQRRQYKLLKNPGAQRSNITPERIEKLLALGFDFEPRKSGSSSRHSED